MNSSPMIPVIADSTISHQYQLVDARVLHGFLEVDARFNDWIARRIAEYGFQEGEDFYSCLSKSTGGRRGREYRITLDMGKELAMVERNEKGKQARRYFIECEKRLVQVAPRDALTIMSQTIGTDGFHMLGAIVKGKVAGLPAHVQRRAKAKIWSQMHAAFGVRCAADIPSDQLDSARNFVAAYALEGEWIGRPDKNGMVLDVFEVSSLYSLLDDHARLSKLRDSILSAARALGSPVLMQMFDQINDGSISFANLDSRRSEIYAGYLASGCRPGGYAATA